ncbi:hypothetical protein OLF34_08430 [Streptococcus pneumoniae]|uniref:hypothetical protein n=1 Tax=Streptococcus pneumoniae TaxID=1313 RepID=UPI0029533349|nr:hypothetical protein [Streptococcus pneumoniae]MDG8235325.1 hypothetical protein [Streptococcus pneumoniae]MDG8627360.1 hypothetical protein [Streptococcus pneumoniae]MDG9229810.1 hypothetical protein [Streptococcus pneumoniae]MDG9281315.1 hypothetical protein [Streptococcus pneumoniae]
MENKFVEFIENNKKVIISSVAVGVVLVLGFGWYSYNQQQAEQQAKIVQLEKDSKSDKEQVDKLFESFDASSDESISKLKELSETSLKTDAGKDYLNNKVKESSKAIVDFHLQKGLAYDVKDSDDKFKDKATLENNVKEINKQIDFIKKVDETFKQENLEETLKSLNDIVDKYQKQIELLKKQEEEKAAEKEKESSSQSNSSGGASNESYNGSSNSNVDYSSSEQTNGYSNNYGSQSYYGSGDSSTNGGSSEQYSSSNPNSGVSNGYYKKYKNIGADGHVSYTYDNESNGDVFDENWNYLGNTGGGIAEPPQR